jgi:hypothetical protein
MYDPDVVTGYSIVIAPEEWDAILDEYVNWKDRRNAGLDVKPWHPLVSFRWAEDPENRVITDARIRLKGNPCCSWEGDKMQFVIAFNQVDRDGRFEGVRKIALDAPFYDPSLLRERVALSYFEDAGFAGSCANHATLTINGELYGLYTNIEFVDDELLDRQFPDEERGSLYKFDYLSQRFENQNGPEGIADLQALYATEDELDELVEAFDMDQALAFWAAEAVINQSDGYWAGSINFFLYDRPGVGWSFLPWDLDNAIDYWNARRSPFKRQDYHGVSGHLDTVFADPDWMQAFREAVAEQHRFYDSDVLIDRIDRYDAQIRPILEIEPHRPFTMNEHDLAVESLRSHLSVRDHYLCNQIRDMDDED